MKKIIFLFLVASSSLFAQKKNSKKIDVENLDYKRSSIYMMTALNNMMPYSSASIDAVKNYPFPTKYNDHSVGERVFNPDAVDIEISQEDYLAQEAIDAFLGKGVLDVLGLNKKINKYAEDNEIAKKMIAKWFNRNESTGAFSLDLIQDRGFYDANQMDVDIASKLTRGNSVLGDAGEQLIDKTFLVVNKFTAIENINLPQAHAAKIALESAQKMKTDTPMNKTLRDKAVKVAQKSYDKLSSGYSMITQAYLYQLLWNDSISAIFYEDYYFDESYSDENKSKRKDLFNESNLFRLNYVGKGKLNIVGPIYPGKKNGNEADVIGEATVRCLNKSYNKLQKRYAQFAVKTPLLTGGKNPTAMIGMKEGLVGGEEFDVFEQNFDANQNMTVYVKVGSIKVDKKAGVWDNRFYATSPPNQSDKEFTTFKGGSKNFYPGMLIQQKTRIKIN